MERIFSDPARLTGEFHFLLMFWGGLIAAFIAALLLFDWLRGRRTTPTMPASYLAGGAALAYAVVACIIYVNTVANFTTLRVEPDYVLLEFAAPHAAQLAIPRGDVRDVLFGFPGKYPGHACYLKIVTAATTSYRSADIDAPLATCKAWRAELTRELLGK